MNTSPKIVKKSSVDQLGAVTFPEFRGEQLELGKVIDFVVPDIGEVQIDPNPSTPADLAPGAPLDTSHIAQIEEASRQKAMAEIQQKVEEEVENRTNEIQTTLAESLENLGSVRMEITKSIEKELVELAVKIAEKIVQREVILDENIALEMTKRAMKQIDRRSLAEVHLNPEDFSFVQEKQTEVDFHGSLKLIEDQTITRGGCLVHTDTGDFDATIESQFEEIIEGLLDS